MAEISRPLVVEGSIDWAKEAVNWTLRSYCAGVRVLANISDIVAIPMFWHMGQFITKNYDGAKIKDASDMAYVMQELRICASVLIVVIGTGLGNNRLLAVGAAFAIGGVIDLAATRAVNKAGLKRLKGSS